MQLDGAHLRGEQLLQYYLALSILRGEALLIKEPTLDMLELIRFVAPVVKADIKGVGVGSKECIFVPTKIVKRIELNLAGASSLPLIRTLLPALLFCGHEVKLSLKDMSHKDASPYYIRDVLLPHLHRYIEKSNFFIEPNGDITLHILGKYLLEAAPPFILRKKDRLVAIRGELELQDDSLVKFIELSLKEHSVPVRLHHTSSKDASLIHLNGLFGGEEGYDNDFAYILYMDIIGETRVSHVEPALIAFKKQLTQPRLSQDLIEDLLIFVGLLGGQLPNGYAETDFLLDELNVELVGSVQRVENGVYVWSRPIMRKFDEE